MQKEVAKLALYQNTLTTTPTAIGYRDAGSTSFTWNVNMAQLLGETLFNKYKAYKVQYTQFNRINNAVTYNYLSGINIIQTSQGGQPQGSMAIIGAVTQSYGTAAEQTWDNYSGLFQFIMIKPDNNLIQLTATFTAITGSGPSSNYGAHFLTFYGLDEYNPLYKLPASPYKNPVNRFFNMEHKNFTLNTNVLVAGGTNEFGTMNANRQQFTFTNINMRHILGAMWNKYDKFNLIMQSYGMGIGTGNYSGDVKNIYFAMEGLQFINNLAIGFNSTIYYDRYAFMGFGTLESATTNFASSGNCLDNCGSTNTFRKPESENVTLSFILSNVSSFNASVAYGNWNLTFMIVGVKE